jgi:predicted phosphodiesterase
MRIAFVSDIHGNLPALEAVLAELARAPVDAVVNLGDLVSGPLWPRETADRLMDLGWPTMAGNHERQLLSLPPGRMGASDAFAAAALRSDQLDWLRSLPPSLHLPPDLWCVHGTPTSDLHYLMETTLPDYGQHGSPGIRAANEAELRERIGAQRAALLACGHSHVPRLAQMDAMPVVNPGSVGLPAYDDDHEHRHVVETGSPHARYARAECVDGSWSVQLCSVAYDHAAAARRAEANNRPDWAHALRSGFALRPAAWCLA